MISAAHVTLTSTEKIHRPTKVAESHDGLGVWRGAHRFDPRLKREEIIKGQLGAVRNLDILINSVEVHRAWSLLGNANQISIARIP